MFAIFSTFRSRLIALLVCLLAVVQLASALATLSSMKADNLQQGFQAIQVAENVFDLSLQERAEQLATGVQILAADFGFKQAVATQEQATIRSVLENHGGRIDADLSLLLSPQGTLLVATNDMVTLDNLTQLVLDARRKGSSSVTKIININNSAYQLVLVPVRVPNLIAWVGMAFLLDQELAEQTKQVTGLDISFVGRSESGRLNSISTLAEDEANRLFSDIRLEQLSHEAQFSEDDSYLSIAVELDADQQWALLHLPFDSWQENYNVARQQLLTIFAVTLSLAILSGWLAARNISRPIHLLVEYASRIGQGREAEPPVAAGELGLLSKTMSGMQESIQKREQELIYRAAHDQLTGLFNRSAVERYLAEQLPRQRGCILLINIRHFKDINNMLGFDNGDLLLCLVAERLKQLPGTNEMLARLGGDEFLVVLPDVLTEAQVEELIAPLKDKFELAGSHLVLDLSVGVLPFVETSQDVNNVMRRVDIATNEAKRQSGGIAVYQAGQDENHQRKLMIIRDLPEALESGQLFVVYQPKVNLSARRCLQAEALIRWQHPTLGFVPPDEFISLLEHSGNIRLVTDWMIEQVLKQLSVWWQQGEKIQVAVNLSVHDLLDETLPESIGKALSTHGLPSAALALEVTESAVMADRSAVLKVLNDLRKLDVKLSIDDFGTGQSSLAYLRDLPVNEVKIDRAFIRDIDTSKGDALIVNATIRMSHGLGFSVTAEGLENEAGLGILESYQCDTIQGYYFSRPLPATEFAQWRQEFHSAPEKWWKEPSSERSDEEERERQ